MLDVSINNLLLKKQDGFKTILDDISFCIPPNNIYTIIGKNGSGKSTLIKSLTGLLERRFYKIDGKILFNDQNIYTLNKNELLELRRKKIKYVFQDAVNSFDPLKKIGYYFDRLSLNINYVEELLEFLLLPESGTLFKLYPYELSGGMAQRVSLVIAFAAHPQTIILDEPTSGIDSPIAGLVLLKLKEFADLNKNSVLLVTQDLLFAKKISSKIAFLIDGSLTKFLPAHDFFDNTKNFKLNYFLNSYHEISS